MTTQSKPATDATPDADVVTIEYDNGVAWVTLNRPDKRNAMNPALNARMHAVLDELEADDRCQVLVLTGAGESFSAGMDLKEYFRETEAKGHIAVRRAQRDSYGWWRRLRWFEKPTIAMVNGWCFGGAFSPLFACDLAVAADEAQFGVSEINWGIIPGGNVTKVLADLMTQREALYYIMTGETFDGRKAAEMKLVNLSVPREQLRARVRALADTLLEKNPLTLKAAKDAFKRVVEMPFDAAEDYLVVRQESLNFLDKTEGRKQGIKQFIDDKTYRPGLGAYKRG
ncbi:p-hydroxycinnamoyl CoA hydratase/lyase [Azospirillum sp. TSO35-2]|uniref:p-hydroxycinnamoyl CoA hydratase/lyase n=1 Tax=Azospirillum sp. TSO35-2 TaxID=716796 RepID=UPI000D607703|nr:p-hydroxycinnamoyl CoA hydratase/lyase [Azospirillum sp. TSO35-2]PWC39845.1 p-hydroxycinnamoyl CoA hydratase/lyase [Azospirillum sp. TSO35-2]